MSKLDEILDENIGLVHNPPGLDEQDIIDYKSKTKAKIKELVIKLIEENDNYTDGYYFDEGVLKEKIEKL